VFENQQGLSSRKKSGKNMNRRMRKAEGRRINKNKRVAQNGVKSNCKAGSRTRLVPVVSNILLEMQKAAPKDQKNAIKKI